MRNRKQKQIQGFFTPSENQGISKRLKKNRINRVLSRIYSSEKSAISDRTNIYSYSEIKRGKVFNNSSTSQTSSKIKLPSLKLNRIKNSLTQWRLTKNQNKKPTLKIKGKLIKNLNFNYSFKTLKNRAVLKKALALITIIAVIITAYFQNTPSVSAATLLFIRLNGLAFQPVKVIIPPIIKLPSPLIRPKILISI